MNKSFISILLSSFIVSCCFTAGVEGVDKKFITTILQGSEINSATYIFFCDNKMKCDLKQEYSFDDIVKMEEKGEVYYTAKIDSGVVSFEFETVTSVSWGVPCKSAPKDEEFFPVSISIVNKKHGQRVFTIEYSDISLEGGKDVFTLPIIDLSN